MIRAGELTDDEIRRRLRRGVDLDLRRELEQELAWREHAGRQIATPRAFVPAWLIAQAANKGR